MPLHNLRGAGAGTKHRRTVILIVLVALVALCVLPGTASAKGTPTGIWLTASDHKVVAGSNVNVTVRVSPIVVGSSVTLKAWDCKNGWVTVGTKNVTASGKVKFTVKPVRNTTVQATWTRGSQTTVSKSLLIKVRAKVTVTATPGTYLTGAGTPIVIKGTVVPQFSATATMFVSKVMPDGSKMPLATIRVPTTNGSGDTSVFSTTWNAPGPGTYVIRARVSGGKGACVEPGEASTSITL